MGAQELVLSWYPHQPESHQLSLTKVCQWRTSGHPDTKIGPGTPGSDKNYCKIIFWKHCFFWDFRPPMLEDWKRNVFAFFRKILVPIVRADPHIVCHKNVVKAWTTTCGGFCPRSQNARFQPHLNNDGSVDEANNFKGTNCSFQTVSTRSSGWGTWLDIVWLWLWLVVSKIRFSTFSRAVDIPRAGLCPQQAQSGSAGGW